MGSSTEASVLEALERAEKSARERRLAASSEAEATVNAARRRAAVITAQAGQRVDDALYELRRAAEAEADTAIADLERAEAERARASTGPGRTVPSFEQVVAVVVAHVLGEVGAGVSPEDHV